MAIRFVSRVAAAGVLAAMAWSVQAQAPATTWDGIYTTEQAGRGEQLYADKCASCHAADLTGSSGPAVGGPDFATGWNDVSLKDLFERVQVTMPADQPGSLTMPEAADIMAFMLSKSGFPAGNADLPGEAMKLAAVKFVAKNPRQP